MMHCLYFLFHVLSYNHGEAREQQTAMINNRYDTANKSMVSILVVDSCCSLDPSDYGRRYHLWRTQQQTSAFILLPLPRSYIAAP